MKLIVGLGNPGSKYELTRHNAGFMMANRLAGSVEWQASSSSPLQYVYTKLGNEEVEIIKPTTFMNESGLAVVGPFKKHQELQITDLIVIHDDLDIELGKYKIQRGKGPQLHYGVESIENHLHTKDFWRVRIGVENRKVKGNSLISGEKYSLQRFTDEEREKLEQVMTEVEKDLLTRTW